MVINGIYFNVEACAAMTQEEFCKVMEVHLAEDFEKKEEFLKKIYEKLKKKSGQ